MILNEFSKVLKTHENEIINGEPAIGLLTEWIRGILLKHPKDNVQKIIHAEIALCENCAGDFMLVAKSESGRVLTHALLEYAKSFEREVMRKWLQPRLASDFKIK